MDESYGQFCTVARGAEALCERWTPLVVRELLCGSRRFNELHRGVPRMFYWRRGRNFAPSSWRWAIGAHAGSAAGCVTINLMPAC